MSEQNSNLQYLLPEAGGVINIDLYHPQDGYKIRLTVRAGTGVDALNDMVETVRYATQTLKLRTTPADAPAKASEPTMATTSPSSPSPAASAQVAAPAQPTQAAGEYVETIHFDTMELMSYKGQIYLACRGGQFQKFGVSCYEEVAKTRWDWDGLLEIGFGKEMQANFDGNVLFKDGKPKKIISFAD